MHRAAVVYRDGLQDEQLGNIFAAAFFPLDYENVVLFSQSSSVTETQNSSKAHQSLKSKQGNDAGVNGNP